MALATVNVRSLLPGLGVAVGVGTAAWAASWAVPSVSPLLWAVALGAAATNLASLPSVLTPGIRFAAKPLLRLGVGLLGFRLALGQVAQVGLEGGALVLAVVGLTFTFTLWLGRRFGLSQPLSMVLAAGTSVCGAAAVVAVAEVSGADERDAAVGIGAVTVFGTLSMALYPVLGRWAGLDSEAFGVWAGASIHEVAQVVAASSAFDRAVGASQALGVATVVKLGRVLTLAPLTVALGVWLRRRAEAGGTGRPPLIPWFVAVFAATFLLRNFGWVPVTWAGPLERGTTLLLTVAMAGLGLELPLSKLRAAGLKPLYITGAASLFIALMAGGWVAVTRA